MFAETYKTNPPIWAALLLVILLFLHSLTSASPSSYSQPLNQSLAQSRYDSLLISNGADDLLTLEAADALLVCRLALGTTGDAATVELGRENLQRRIKILGPHHLAVGFSHSTLGAILNWNQDYPEAKLCHDRALPILRDQLDDNDPHLGHALLQASDTYRELRDYATAESLMDAAEQVFLNSSGEQSLNLADVHNLQANLYRNQGRLGEALAASELALKIQLEMLPHNDIALAVTYARLGHIYNSRQRHEDGFLALDRAITIYDLHLSPNSPITAFALTITAEYLARIGEFQAAEARLLRALSIRGAEFGEDSQPYSTILVRLGRFYGRLGQYEKAIECQIQVVAIRRQTQPLGDHTTSIAWWSLAKSRLQLGDIAGARSDLLAALFAVQGEQQTVPLWRARFHRELSRTEFLLGDLAAARQSADRAWAIVGNFDEMSLEREELLLLTGDLSGAENQSETARKCYLEAIRIAAPRGEFGHDTLISAWEKLAVLELNNNRPKQAQEYLQQALDLGTTFLGDDHPQVAQTTLAMAQVQFALGHHEAALALVLTAERNSRRHFRRMARTMSEASALRYAQVRPSGLPLALALTEQLPTAKDIAAVWSEVATSRALVLDEISRRYQYRETLSPEAVAQKIALQVYANLLVRGPLKNSRESYADELRSARNAVDQLEKSMAVGLNTQRPYFSDESVDIAQLQHHLSPKTSLLAFAKQTSTGQGPDDSNTSYFGFLISSESGKIHSWRVGDCQLIDQLVAQMRASLQAPAEHREEIYRAAATQLRRLIWDPIADLCASRGEVLVVPDGTLNLISFGALPVLDDQYLIEQCQFHYLTTERNLLRPAAKLTDEPKLLALGGVDFETITDAPLVVAQANQGTIFRSALGDHPTLQGLVFQPLPASYQEVQQVASIWRRQFAHSPPTILTGAAASEQAFKQSAAGYTVIHLATHGFTLDSSRSPLPTTFRGVGGLAIEPQGSSAILPAATSFPVTGLALAGANLRSETVAGQDDGILTALEIASLNLQGTVLVVLSGCDTGGGSVRDGEGVFGLRRAVNMAGARSLIMSLWPAEDEITRDWMNSMYLNFLVAENSVTESVRLASLTALQKRRADDHDTHPAFWGCFIATGD